MRILYRIARAYWFFRRPTTYGVKIALKNHDTILLVRHTYQPESWTFPGGGVKRGENKEDALRREIKEEVGINLRKITYAGEFKNKQDFKNDTLSVYYASIDNPNIICDQLEIIEGHWFSLANMPRIPPNAQKIFNIARPFL